MNRLLNILTLLRWPIIVLIISAPILTQLRFTRLEIDPNLVLEYLKVIVWPSFFTLVLIMNRKVLPQLFAGLFNRIEEIEILGNKAKFQQQTEKKEQNESVTEQFEEVDADASKPVVKPKDDFQIVDDETHALLTSPDVKLAYEDIYRVLFGTQIEALRQLVTYSEGLKASDLQGLLDKHMKLSNGAGFNDVTSYMQYLKQNILVTYEPDTQVYQITNAGYYFLVYLTQKDLLNSHKNW